MYAVVQIGGAQFKVSEGDVISTDRRPEDKDKKITIDKVLLFSKGNDIRIGQPYLKDVKVAASVVRQDLGEKVVTLKYRRRKNSATRTGTRKRNTVLNITKITA